MFSNNILNKKKAVFFSIVLTVMLTFMFLIYGTYADTRTEDIEFDINNPQIREILSKYDKKDKEALKKTLQDIIVYLNSLKKNVPIFVDEVYSLKSKFSVAWKISGDKCSDWFGNGRRNETGKYIKNIWNRTMFTPNEVSNNIQAYVNELVYTLQGNRNKMAVEIEETFALVDGDFTFDKNYVCNIVEKRMLKAASSTTNTGICAEIVSLVGGEIATYAIIAIINHLATISTEQIATQAAFSVAASSAALTGGTISGWATFGIGLAVGILIDLGVTAHSKKKMEATLNSAIDDLKKLFVYGDGKRAGLKKILQDSLFEYQKDKHKSIFCSLQQIMVENSSIK